ncbi:class I SAM-dependent methyltransferase [Streptomyces sp. NBC_01717]|uniref:class I SAM-dependent methyltransferase n=1 Tax=Streptomyces sp. NBC_01717 TaxID=2975918 RepID=UPI002E2FF22E|nr:methyltransferase domain-containing protein [Streptomyces sp. NBC_01717]
MSGTVPNRSVLTPVPPDNRHPDTAHPGTAHPDIAHPDIAAWSTDPYADALRNGHGPLFLRRADGWLLPLDVERWCGGADAADRSALRRCEGPVLDIGCGPGRLVAELAAHGHRALGIDVSETAVAHTLRIGGSALRRSVFDPLPGEGRWGTVLLIDGNIGIGGDPHGLLLRTAELLAPGGLLIAETVSPDIDERVQVRLYDGRRAPDGVGGPDCADAGHFPWARIGTPALLRYARPNGWLPADQWVADGRPFVALRRDRRVRTVSQSADTANSAAVISSQFPRKTSGDSPLAGS